MTLSESRSRDFSPASWSSGLSGTITSPVLAATQYSSINSWQFGSRVTNLSPFARPRPRTALASALTRAFIVR
jgi:hypothetical protein